MTEDAWQSVSVDQLEVGQFIRLGHRWFEHPFLLNRFRITSEKEIAIIRDAGLTRIYVSPDRSLANGADAPRGAPVGTDTTVAPEQISSAVQLQFRKDALAERVRGQHEMLAETGEHYASAVASSRRALDLLAAGKPAAVAAVGELARTLVAHVTQRESPLTFASAVRPKDAAMQRACRSLDAAAIAAAVGRRLGLPAAGLTTLTTAALLHAVGIEELPAVMQNEATIRNAELLADFRQYPLLGVDLLRRCGDFPPELLQIVRQHRERLDGSGFPETVKGDRIHPYARVIGAIREFQVLADRGESAMPATALAQLFRKLRGAYGPVAVDNVIAALTIYPPGSFLALTDGSIGRVVQVSETSRLRPKVCLFDDAVDPSESQIIDLAETEALSVARVLDPAQLESEVLEFFGAGWPGISFARGAPLAA